MKNLAIIGSRGITNFDLSEFVGEEVSAIITGGAKGVDTIAAKYAREHGIGLVEFLPEYDKYGRRAPLVRNRTIVKECDQVLAIWDGKSKGTAFTINLAKKEGKPVRIVYC